MKSMRKMHASRTGNLGFQASSPIGSSIRHLVSWVHTAAHAQGEVGLFDVCPSPFTRASPHAGQNLAVGYMMGSLQPRHFSNIFAPQIIQYAFCSASRQKFPQSGQSLYRSCIATILSDNSLVLIMTSAGWGRARPFTFRWQP